MTDAATAFKQSTTALEAAICLLHDSPGLARDAAIAAEDNVDRLMSERERLATRLPGFAYTILGGLLLYAADRARVSLPDEVVCAERYCDHRLDEHSGGACWGCVLQQGELVRHEPRPAVSSEPWEIGGECVPGQVRYHFADYVLDDPEAGHPLEHDLELLDLVPGTLREMREVGMTACEAVHRGLKHCPYCVEQFWGGERSLRRQVLDALREVYLTREEVAP